MSFTIIDIGNIGDLLDPWPDDTRVHDLGMPLNIQIKPADAVLGFEPGTISNPTYGSGIILPIRGKPTYDRPLDGTTKPRPDSGIVYPVF